MKRIALFSVLFLYFLVKAQTPDCNQTVWSTYDAEKIPKGVCLPNGYEFLYVHTATDINGDGLYDFIFNWDKILMRDGDTTFVSVYVQNPDSTFSHFRTFNNLFPTYFNRYDDNYIPQDTALIPLLRRYEATSTPFRKLEFKQDSLIITICLDAKSDLRTVYVYDKNLNNWLYKESSEVWYEGGGVSRDDLEDKLGPTIDDFTYFWWNK